MRVTCYLLDYLVRLLPQKRVWVNLLNWVSSLKRFKSFNTIRGFFTASWLILIDQKWKEFYSLLTSSCVGVIFMMGDGCPHLWIYCGYWWECGLWIWIVDENWEYQESFKIQKDGVAGQLNGENKVPLTPILKHCQRHYGPRRRLLQPVVLVWFGG